MVYFVLGWILIGLGILGLSAGMIFMALRKREIQKELEHIQGGIT